MLEAPPKKFMGFAYGSRYPSLVFTLTGPALPLEVRDKITADLKSILPDLGDIEISSDTNASWHGTLLWMLNILNAYQSAAGLPVFEQARVLALKEQGAECQIATLGRSLGLMSEMVRCTLALTTEFANRRPTAPAAAELAKLFAQLRASNYRSSNVPRFIRAAFDLGIPFRELPGQFLQFGEGHNACWLDSTFTDATPYISAQLAKDKLLSAALMRQAGLPVPEHYRAGSEREAVHLADNLGYPVVVKPANLDGGVGVSAGLRNAKEVAAAFDSARKVSNQILIEQHVHGADYRLTVLRDQVIWAVERVPAGVTGDGHSTIDELIATVNSDPRRGDGQHFPLKKLELDSEARELLLQEGFDQNSVLPVNRFIRLRRTANIASGGMPVAVFDRVHPDNARLAVRAARALQLDLAGVDLLIPDISKSWCETGAAICEVNAQPQLGGTTSAHVYPQILQRLLKGDGRIITVVVLGDIPDGIKVKDLAVAFNRMGLTVGTHDSNGVRVNDEILVQGPSSLNAAGMMLSLDRRVEVMILSANSHKFLETASPVQRINALIVAGHYFEVPSGAGDDRNTQLYNEILRMIVPACEKVVTGNDDLSMGEVAKSLIQNGF